MNRQKAILYLGITGCAALICASFTFCIISTLTPDAFTFCVDPLVTQETEQAIIKTAHYLYKTKNETPWHTQLKEAYPIIKSISWKKTKSKSLLVTIRIDAPWLLANDNLVLTERGALVSRSLYGAHYMQLPRVIIKSPANYLEPYCMSWLEQFPSSFFATHAITIENAGSIIVHDLAKKLFPIRLRAEQKIDESVLDQCSDAQKKLVEQKKLKKIIPTAWLADIRFHKQIIVYQAKGREERG
ncbi:hypothetical protein HYX58_00190 [Candidatus Dependentiae bacterium]|nr:hypothetical protein [Candidatus Dependentiae bacterium]